MTQFISETYEPPEYIDLLLWCKSIKIESSLKEDNIEISPELKLCTHDLLIGCYFKEYGYYVKVPQSKSSENMESYEDMSIDETTYEVVGWAICPQPAVIYPCEKDVYCLSMNYADRKENKDSESSKSE